MIVPNHALFNAFGSTVDDVVKPSIEQEIAALREEIREHDRRYYVDAAPTISDLEYDKFKGLEAAHPELITPDSQRPAKSHADLLNAEACQLFYRRVTMVRS